MDRDSSRACSLERRERCRFRLRSSRSEAYPSTHSEAGRRRRARKLPDNFRQTEKEPRRNPGLFLSHLDKRSRQIVLERPGDDVAVLRVQWLAPDRLTRPDRITE